MKILVVVGDSSIIPAFYCQTKGIKLNIMISYQYLRGQAQNVTEKYRDMIGLLYLDSGAFSASKGRSKITVQEYLGYLKMYGHLFDAVFNFDDKFDDPQHNLQNQIYLEEGLEGTGVVPVPVVHDAKDPFREFEMYAQSGHSFIAVGSNQALPDEVFEKIKKEFPNVKVHMFGTLERGMLFKHKPYSADSSVYLHDAGTGHISYWDPMDKKECTIHVDDLQKFHHKKELEKFLSDTFEYDYQKLLTSYRAKQIVNIYFMKQLEDRVNESK